MTVGYDILIHEAKCFFDDNPPYKFRNSGFHWISGKMIVKILQENDVRDLETLIVAYLYGLRISEDLIKVKFGGRVLKVVRELRNEFRSKDAKRLWYLQRVESMSKMAKTIKMAEMVSDLKRISDTEKTVGQKSCARAMETLLSRFGSRPNERLAARVKSEIRYILRG